MWSNHGQDQGDHGQGQFRLMNGMSAYFTPLGTLTWMPQQAMAVSAPTGLMPGSNWPLLPNTTWSFEVQSGPESTFSDQNQADLSNLKLRNNFSEEDPNSQGHKPRNLFKKTKSATKRARRGEEHSLKNELKDLLKDQQVHLPVQPHQAGLAKVKLPYRCSEEEDPNSPGYKPLNPPRKKTKSAGKAARKKRERQRLHEELHELRGTHDQQVCEERQQQRNQGQHRRVRKQDSPDSTPPCLPKLQGGKKKRAALARWVKSPKVQDKLELVSYPNSTEMLKDLAGKEIKVQDSKILRTKECKGGKKMLTVAVLVGGIRVGRGSAEKELDAREIASRNALELLFGADKIPPPIKKKKKKNNSKESISNQGRKLRLNVKEKFLVDEAFSKLIEIENFKQNNYNALSKIQFKDFSGRGAMLRMVTKKKKLPLELGKLYSCKFLLEILSGVPERDWKVVPLQNQDVVVLSIPGIDVKVESKKEAIIAQDNDSTEKMAHEMLCILYPYFTSWQQCVYDVIDRVQLMMEDEMKAKGVPPVSRITSRAIGAMKYSLRARLY